MRLALGLGVFLIGCGASHEPSGDGGEDGGSMDAVATPDSGVDSSGDSAAEPDAGPACLDGALDVAPEPVRTRCIDDHTDCPADTPFCCICSDSIDFAIHTCLESASRSCFDCVFFTGCTERTPSSAVTADCLSAPRTPDSARCPASHPICCETGATVICTDRIPYGWNCDT